VGNGGTEWWVTRQKMLEFQDEEILQDTGQNGPQRFRKPLGLPLRDWSGRGRGPQIIDAAKARASTLAAHSWNLFGTFSEALHTLGGKAAGKVLNYLMGYVVGAQGLEPWTR